MRSSNGLVDSGPGLRPRAQAQDSGPELRSRTQVQSSGPGLRLRAQAQSSGPELRPRAASQVVRIRTKLAGGLEREAKIFFLPKYKFFSKGGGAQWTNTGLDPQISKFSGQEWTGTDKEGGIVWNSPKIKSRESFGKVPGKKKKKKNLEKKEKNLGTKKKIKK